MSPNMVKLMVKDGKSIVVCREYLKQSMMITEMIRNLGFGDEEEIPSGITLPVEKISLEIFEIVMTYCKQHHEEWLEEQKHEKSDNASDATILSDWDENFLKLDKRVLFELMMAADYLSIENLLDVSCQAIANLTKGKTTEEIREIFEIRNDLTPEAQAELNKEHAWCG